MTVAYEPTSQITELRKGTHLYHRGTPYIFTHALHRGDGGFDFAVFAILKVHGNPSQFNILGSRLVSIPPHKVANGLSDPLATMSEEAFFAGKELVREEQKKVWKETNSEVAIKPITYTIEEPWTEGLRRLRYNGLSVELLDQMKKHVVVEVGSHLEFLKFQDPIFTKDVPTP